MSTSWLTWQTMLMELHVALSKLVDFRVQVYGSFTLRADVLFELVEALLLSPIIRCAVEVSQSSVFRRSFASVYDGLRHAKIDHEALRKVLVTAEPSDATTVGGYAVYAADTTPAPRPDAETVRERTKVYSAEHDKAIPGHQFSWLGRPIAWGQSWFAPRDVQRVPASSSACQVAAEQVKRLADDPKPTGPKAVVLDSYYPQPSLLRVFVGLAPQVVLLVRLASNRVMYGAPPPPTGKRGRPRVHGEKLHLKAPRKPDREETVSVWGEQARVGVWLNQHFKAVPNLVGMVLRVEFLKPDGSPRYKRPLWLFWNGRQTIPLAELVQMYRLRFVIEHFFRFLKQRLGLLATRVTDLNAIETWVWGVALAYWQLLLARKLVKPSYRPWDPTARQDPNWPLTPGQVLTGWPAFSRGLELPTVAPRPAGKAPGRAVGFRPKPRQRYPLPKARRKKVKSAA